MKIRLQYTVEFDLREPGDLASFWAEVGADQPESAEDQSIPLLIADRLKADPVAVIASIWNYSLTQRVLMAHAVKAS